VFEAYNLVAQLFQASVTRRVVCLLCFMNSTIKLDYKAGISTVEINYESSNDGLAAKLEAANLTVSNEGPHQVLGIRWLQPHSPSLN
jgi:hypothetical protein